MMLAPVDVHGALDEMGALPDAHGAGTYALDVSVPNGVEAVQRAWLAVYDGPLPDAYAEQLAGADECVYVGRSGRVYNRLMDHAKGKVRKAAFVAAFDVTGVRGVWPGDENTDTAERDRAREIATATTLVWTDGELF